MTKELKLTLAQDNLKRVSDWISHADRKVGMALIAQAGLTGFLTTSKIDDLKTILNQQFDFVHFVLYLLLVFFGIFIARAAYHSFKALYPDVKLREESLFFFGSINAKGQSKFKKDFDKLTDEEALEDINNQVFVNSTIASEKFEDVKKSIINTALASITWVAILTLISILK